MAMNGLMRVGFSKPHHWWTCQSFPRLYIWAWLHWPTGRNNVARLPFDSYAALFFQCSERN
jgi:hypothetical protein